MNKDVKLAFASFLNPFVYYLNLPSEKRKIVVGKPRTDEERRKIYNRLKGTRKSI